MSRFTEADVAKHQRKMGKTVVRAPKKPSKFSNVKEKVDGISFDSKREAQRYRDLKMLRAAGRIRFFIRQPVFDCGGGVVYRGDFLIVWSAGLAVGDTVTVEDVKGVDTQESINKRKQVLERYGVEVQLVA